MFMKTLYKEFIYDCRVRNLAPRTSGNYEKQLDYNVSIHQRHSSQMILEFTVLFLVFLTFWW